jgi:hypothetical protein
MKRSVVAGCLLVLISIAGCVTPRIELVRGMVTVPGHGVLIDGNSIDTQDFNIIP